MGTWPNRQTCGQLVFDDYWQEHANSTHNKILLVSPYFDQYCVRVQHLLKDVKITPASFNIKHDSSSPNRSSIELSPDIV